MKNKFGQNLSQIGALYDFYGQKNLGRQSSGIELSTVYLPHNIITLRFLLVKWFRVFSACVCKTLLY